MAGHGIVFQRRLYFRARPLKPFLISVIPATSQILVRKVTGSSLQFLYQQSQELFVTLPLKRSVPCRNVTSQLILGFPGPLRAILAVRQLHRESQK